MEESMSLSLRQKQQLVMTREMQQALQVLQMPLMELATLIDQELAQNPLLEFEEPGPDGSDEDLDLELLEEAEEEPNLDDEDTWEEEIVIDHEDFEILKKLDESYQEHFSLSESFTDRSKMLSYLESQIVEPLSLYEALMEQAAQAGLDHELAQLIIGNLDDDGFFSADLRTLERENRVPLGELQKTLQVVQTFTPDGIGAANLRESLLLQLRQLGREKSPAYAVLEEHYDLLMSGEWERLSKKISIPVEEVREEIGSLNFHPGGAYDHDANPIIIPDVVVREEGDELSAEVNGAPLPSLRFNHKLLLLMQQKPTEEVAAYLKEKWGSGRWLMRNIHARGETLQRVSDRLIEWQGDYLRGTGRLVPMAMQALATELGLHESTIARTVSNKFMNCPRGTIAMRSLFSGSFETEGGRSLSRNAVRELVVEIITAEEKHRPFTDDQICEQLAERGLRVARRTVAKYRQQLGIGNRAERKRFQK
jgi:RNA polymerase sigma-54 factor